MRLFKNLAGVSVLGAGILALAIPAHADTYQGTVGVSQSGYGQLTSSNLGSVSSVQCALTRVRETSANGVRTQCYLMQVSGQWKLRAEVETLGGSGFIHCEATCYQ